jgi:hypothetical protein
LTPSPNEDALFVALRAFLLLILPAGVEVIQGQTNRVASPKSVDYVVIWPTGRTRQATNVDTWDTSDPAPVTIDVSASTRFTVQIEAHGPNGGDNAQVMVTMLRSFYAVDNFPAGIAPLYADDPQQLPFMTGENQYEDRWVIMAQIQMTPLVSTPAQFADSLAVTVAVPADTGA